MANYTYFYTIGFYDKEGNGVNRDIVSFLDKIEARIQEDDVRIVRSINKEFLRMFLFSRDLMKLWLSPWENLSQKTNHTQKTGIIQVN